MAKKKETKTVTEEVTQVVEQPKETWEVKDRMYYLKGDKKPLSRMIKSACLYWFEKEKQYEREIK